MVRCLFSRRLFQLVAAFVFSAPVLANAGQFIVNDVPIGKVELSVQGLEGVTFEKCSWVKVAANGDVNANCPGYDLKPALPAAETVQAPAPVVSQPKKTYWLVTEQAERGATQFDIDIYINSKWIKRVKNDDDQLVMDISEHLLPGVNKVLLTAKKDLTGGRRSASPNLFYRIVIGGGQAGGGNVVIDNPVVDVRRTAAETEDVIEEREFTVR